VRGDRRTPAAASSPFAVVALSLLLAFAIVEPAIAEPAVPASPPFPLRLPGAPANLGANSTASQASGSGSAEPTSQLTRVTLVPQTARDLVVALNKVRRLHKLRPLVISSQLQRAGQAHARALAFSGQFTHSWPDGRGFGTWIRAYYPAARFKLWTVGENLVWSSPGLTPDQAIREWLASPAHRRNMLTPSWRQVGLGVVSAIQAPGEYGGADVTIAAAEFGLRT
jgi:uncharacterized protein YkwD